MQYKRTKIVDNENFILVKWKIMYFEW